MRRYSKQIIRPIQKLEIFGIRKLDSIGVWPYLQNFAYPKFSRFSTVLACDRSA